MFVFLVIDLKLKLSNQECGYGGCEGTKWVLSWLPQGFDFQMFVVARMFSNK